MREQIVVHPNFHFGKPGIAGTRITVESELELVREEIAPQTSIENIIQN